MSSNVTCDLNVYTFAFDSRPEIAKSHLPEVGNPKHLAGKKKLCSLRDLLLSDFIRVPWIKHTGSIVFNKPVCFFNIFQLCYER